MRSILDAATNDLALLINTLDLQATPGRTPNATPLLPRALGLSTTASHDVSSSATSTYEEQKPAGGNPAQPPDPTTTEKTQTQPRVADNPLKKNPPHDWGVDELLEVICPESGVPVVVEFKSEHGDFPSEPR